MKKRKIKHRKSYKKKEKYTSTGVVDDIWLQFSSNVSLLHDELVWLREKHGIDGRNGPVKLFGSMFVPTPVWLNRFRFRPWNGVFVDANFLSNVESAQQGAKSILKVYRAMNVSPLIESPSLKDIDIIRANDFLHSIMNNINDKNRTATKLFEKMKNEERKPIDTGDISIVEHETNPVVVLLRNELRLHDNPLLSYAASLRRPVCLLYVWAPEKNNKWSLENTACGIWLQESLHKLDLKLRDKHFHQELIDTDISINAMMWQNAGRSGIDQWNFFMSPVNASQDPTGNYTKKWVPELQKLPLKFLHNPWNAPSNVLVNAGVILGSTYPKRICLDITAARNNSKTAVLEMRRDNQAFNDEGGYDVILLPDGSRSRVFTRRDLRLNRDGSIKVFKGKKRTKKEGKKAKKKTKNKIAKDNNQKSITSFFAISTTTASKKIKS